MPRPRALAILLGAGPTSGFGLAKTLASPAHGNLAVALLARNPSNLSSLTSSVRDASHGGILKDFPADAGSEQSLSEAFRKIKEWNEAELGGLKLRLAVWHVKHSHRTSFEEETVDRFRSSLDTYVGGAAAFAKLVTEWMLHQDSSSAAEPLQSAMLKRGTLIFTGTLGALRTNANYAAYGAGRAGVRMLAQSLAREYTGRGVHVVHSIANGGIGGDGEENEAKFQRGEKMRSESLGNAYLWLEGQDVDLWTHELDLRPAAEKF